MSCGAHTWLQRSVQEQAAGRRTDSESVGVAASSRSVPCPLVPRLTSVPCLHGRPGLSSPAVAQASQCGPAGPCLLPGRGWATRQVLAGRLPAARLPLLGVAGLCLARICPGGWLRGCEGGLPEPGPGQMHTVSLCIKKKNPPQVPPGVKRPGFKSWRHASWGTTSVSPCP